MSSQQPGGPRPGSEPGVDAAVPAPVPAPSAAAGRTAPGGSPGWGTPEPPDVQQAAEAAPGWGAPGWGAPAGSSGKPSGDKPWTVKRGLLVGGVAALLAVGAGTGVYALTSSPASANGNAAGFAGQRLGTQGAQGMPGAPQDGQAGGAMPGQGGHDDFAAGGMGGGLSAAVHAEYVTLQGSTYTTMAEQLGTVAEVSSTSVTVKSSDGFTRTYALGGDVAVGNMQRRQQSSGTGVQLGVADIVAGGTVRVVATKVGSGYTASSVMLVATTAAGQSN